MASGYQKWSLHPNGWDVNSMLKQHMLAPFTSQGYASFRSFISLGFNDGYHIKFREDHWVRNVPLYYTQWYKIFYMEK